MATMASKTKPTTNPTPAAPATEPLFEAFPEPRSWACNWDGPALQHVAKRPGPQPTHKRP